MTTGSEGMTSSLRILLVEDNQDFAYVLTTRFSMLKNPAFEMIHAETLQAGIESLTSQKFDAVLLDLTLPDSHGLDTFIRLYAHAPGTPVVVLTGIEDEAIGLQAVHRGAQDFLSKRKADWESVSKVLMYAIERHRTQGTLATLSLTDELTGLHNRRGFLALAEQQLKLANRNKQSLLIVFVDLDGFKKINDTFGHQEGDLALIEVAKILKSCFRGSDVIARVGGDEFAVLAIDANQESGEILKKRLDEKIKENNEESTLTRKYKIAFSYGVVNFDPNQPASLGELMSSADRAMYAKKRSGS